MFETAKYIKLGEKGEWEPLCFKDGTLRLGYYEVPHELGQHDSKDKIRDIYIDRGLTAGAATNHARQVSDFYQADANTLWITFSKGDLWWCQASGPVEFLGADKTTHPNGSRTRPTVAGWSNRSILGQPLHMNDLSGRLTRSAAYRGVICNINGSALEYLKRKICGQDLPAVIEARDARQKLLEKVKSLINLLTWQDFELFVDILFTRSGWLRVSEAGKTMKDIDLELVLPVTGEKAVVQIKSKTNQSELDEYNQALQSFSCDRAFFVYHTPQELLSSPENGISVMNIDLLAEAALRTGLIDWLIEKN